MHVAGKGIKAVGKVLEQWDGKAYRDRVNGLGTWSD